MEELTEYGFNEKVRNGALRYSKTANFSPIDLDRASAVYSDTLKEMGRTSLNKDHFDDAFKRMERHSDWSRLTPHQKAAFQSAVEQHLGIER